MPSPVSRPGGPARADYRLAHARRRRFLPHPYHRAPRRARPGPASAGTSPSTTLDRPPAGSGAAETALLDERRLLTGEELGRPGRAARRWVTSLAALAHQVRLAWCGPEVEVEGILSAKTGGCPEDCHFCSQSSRFDSPVKATPFLDTDEVLTAAEETRAAGASEFCIVLAIRGPDERTHASGSSSWCRSSATAPGSTWP